MAYLLRTLRRITLTCLLVVWLLLPAGCDRDGGGASAGAPAVELRFWNGFTGPDGRTMLGLVRAFNAANPDVRVVMQRMEWGTYYNKLFVAGLGGRAPEVFVSHTDAIARFRHAGFVRPVDDLVGTGDAVPLADLDETAWAGVAAEGKHWGVPLDIHPVGMFYNKRMFREAGIVDASGEPRPPTTRAEFTDALRKLKGPGGRWGFVYTWQRINVYAVIAQFGGGLYDFERERVTMDSPANVAALDYCASLVRDGLSMPPENANSWSGFLQGRVGIGFNGIFALEDVKRQGAALEWAAAPLPVLGERPGTWAGSHNLCLRSDLTAEELAAAKRFIRFLSDRSLDWAEGGQVPVRKSLRDTDRFRAMHAQYEFSKQIPYCAYTPQVTFVTEMMVEFDLAVEKGLRGSLTAQAALAEAQRRTVAAANRYQGEEPAAAVGGDAK